jgi:hypothetical protein
MELASIAYIHVYKPRRRRRTVVLNTNRHGVPWCEDDMVNMKSSACREGHRRRSRVRVIEWYRWNMTVIC